MTRIILQLILCSSLFFPSFATEKGYAKGAFFAKTVPKNGRFFKISKNNITKNEFVLDLHNAKVYGSGYILDNRDFLLKDTINLWPGRTINDTALMRRKNFKKKKICGSVVILSNSGENNYYHWLFQILPRIHIFSRSGFKCTKFYLENIPTLPFQIESLRLLNIPLENIITSEEDTIIEADEIFVPSISTIPAKHGKFAFQGWVLDWLKEVFLEKNRHMQDKLIYISRKDASFRRIKNEEELVVLLKKLGFEIVYLSELSVCKQAELFNRAKVVVAQHGAGLANIAFSRKGVTLVEIEAAPPYRDLVETVEGTHIKFNKVKKILTNEDKLRLESLKIPEDKINDCLDIEVDLTQLEKLINSIIVS